MGEKMRHYFYGSAEIAEEAIPFIQADMEEVFFCNEDEGAQEISGIRSVTFHEMMDGAGKVGEGKIYIASSNMAEAVDRIRNNSSIDAIEVTGIQRDCLKDGMTNSIFFPINISKPRLFYLEYHIAFHCNLKCKGCTHFSNIADPEFGDYQQFERDMNRLKDLYWGIRKVRLLGGEPLLNPELPRFIQCVRNVFPDADIRVVSNGLLIPGMKDELFEVMKENEAFFDITQYPPTSKMAEKIGIKCRAFGVRYRLSNVVEKFYDKRNENGDADIETSYRNCVSAHCHSLFNGRVSLCPRPIVFEKFRDKVNPERDDMTKDMIDLYDNTLDGFLLNEMLSKPIDSCRFCYSESDARYFQWEGNYPHIL